MTSGSAKGEAIGAPCWAWLGGRGGIGKISGGRRDWIFFSLTLMPAAVEVERNRTVGYKLS